MEKNRPSKKAYMFIAISSILSVIGFISIKNDSGYEWLFYVASVFAIIGIVLTFRGNKKSKNEL